MGEAQRQEGSVAELGLGQLTEDQLGPVPVTEGS